MNVRRKSLHRKRNCKHAKKRVNQRAAKARHRIARALAPVDYNAEPTEAEHCPLPGPPLRFRVIVECLTDHERVAITTTELPHGWTISPTLCGQKVTKIINHYRPF